MQVRYRRDRQGVLVGEVHLSWLYDRVLAILSNKRSPPPPPPHLYADLGLPPPAPQRPISVWR